MGLFGKKKKSETTNEAVVTSVVSEEKIEKDAVKPVNDIFADIVKKVSKRYGSNVSFLFGDWAYISNQLTLWGKSPKTSKLKFPIIKK